MPFIWVLFRIKISTKNLREAILNGAYFQAAEEGKFCDFESFGSESSCVQGASDCVSKHAAEKWRSGNLVVYACTVLKTLE